MPHSNFKRIERAASGKQTPLLVMDRGLVRTRFGEIRGAFGDARICYALKTNPHWRIVDLLYGLGSDFEVSTEEELRLLLRRGVPAGRIIASNPTTPVGNVYASASGTVICFLIVSVSIPSSDAVTRLDISA